MKSIIILTILVISFLTIQAYGQDEIRSTGLGFRISYYDAGGHSATFERIGYLNYATEANGGAGISFFLFSRFSDRLAIEFSAGGLASFSADQRWHMEEEVEVFSAVPLLTGIRIDLLPINSQSIIKPYVSAGPGAYILSDIHVVREFGVERGTVDTRLAGGGYAAAGLNLHFSPGVALNFEAKYHLVDFDVNHDRSGVDVGLGMVFLWGSYTSTSEQIVLNIKD
jgi:hypothetical protein